MLFSAWIWCIKSLVQCTRWRFPFTTCIIYTFIPSFCLCRCSLLHTVEPVLRGHPLVPEKLALKDRGPFIGGASEDRFDCTLIRKQLCTYIFCLKRKLYCCVHIFCLKELFSSFLLVETGVECSYNLLLEVCFVAGKMLPGCQNKVWRTGLTIRRRFKARIFKCLQ